MHFRNLNVDFQFLFLQNKTHHEACSLGPQARNKGFGWRGGSCQPTISDLPYRKKVLDVSQVVDSSAIMGDKIVWPNIND